jgi:hypothetical protein
MEAVMPTLFSPNEQDQLEKRLQELHQKARVMRDENNVIAKRLLEVRRQLITKPNDDDLLLEKKSLEEEQKTANYAAQLKEMINEIGNLQEQLTGTKTVGTSNFVL